MLAGELPLGSQLGICGQCSVGVVANADTGVLAEVRWGAVARELWLMHTLGCLVGTGMLESCSWGAMADAHTGTLARELLPGNPEELRPRSRS